MTVFSIYQADAEAPEAVPERFSIFAALVPPVYALVHGLWLELIGFIVLLVLVGVLGVLAGPDAAALSYAAIALLIGFEAPALRGAALHRRGKAYRADIIAPAADQAEVEWLKAAPRA
jgi:Protein of unknown function (DUF2628)